MTNTAPIRALRIVSLIEGATLLALIGIAVPLKHLGGYPLATAVVGPVHGLAFLLYAWMVVNTVSGGGWTRGETARLLIAAFVPFGAFFVAGLLRRKEAQLAGVAT